MKYFDGPSGFYYDKKHDEIFSIEHNGARLFNTKTMKDCGPMYEYRKRGVKKASVAMVGMDHCVFLGPIR